MKSTKAVRDDCLRGAPSAATEACGSGSTRHQGQEHSSIRTEKAYVQWIRRYILFHSKRHPREMGHPEINAFLSHPATARRVAASTQNAILFLYKEILEQDPGPLEEIVRAKKPRIPVVLAPQEVAAIPGQRSGSIGSWPACFRKRGRDTATA